MTELRNVAEEFQVLTEEIKSALANASRQEFSHLQNYIYFFHHPLFSITEAVIILTEKGKHHAAKILLRTLYESHINIIYHQFGNSDKRLAIHARKGAQEKLTIVTEALSLIEKFPNLESQVPTDFFSKEWLVPARQWATDFRDGIVRANQLESSDTEPGLQEKAMRCDKEAIKNAVPGHFQRMYTVIYRQLSPLAHLNIEGLQSYVSASDGKKFEFYDGDDGDFLVHNAIEICLAYMRDLYDLALLPGPLPPGLERLEGIVNGIDGAQSSAA